MAAKWYVLHVYSGFENKVAQSIREQAVQHDPVAARAGLGRDVVNPLPAGDLPGRHDLPRLQSSRFHAGQCILFVTT